MDICILMFIAPQVFSLISTNLQSSFFHCSSPFIKLPFYMAHVYRHHTRCTQTENVALSALYGYDVASLDRAWPMTYGGLVDFPNMIYTSKLILVTFQATLILITSLAGSHSFSNTDIYIIMTWHSLHANDDLCAFMS